MNADSVIVGAGIAGLRCGIELLKKRPSHSIVILEKYKYTGGRVVTYHKVLEDMKGRCSKIQWENGAGRIHVSHTKILSLVKHYGLHTAPIPDTIVYEEDGVLTPNIFTDTMKLLSSAIQQLPDDYLATHTLREVLNVVLGEEKTEALLLQFPYKAEVDTLRADIGLQSFKDEMGTYKGYVVVKEGLSALIQAMVKDFDSRGGTLFQGHEVTDIQQDGSLLLVKAKTESGDVVFETFTCICALHKDAVASIPLFKGWDVLDKLKMEPLVRTYAVFPPNHGVAWFADLPKVVSKSFVRFFIPMDPSCGSVMISYTDGDDARRILLMLDRFGEEATGDRIVEEVRKMFPDRNIPDPLFFKAHPWTSGCTYWLPGPYDPEDASRDALHPFPSMNVYCCGESFSLRQAWMEGAVEHADQLLELLLSR
jgi:monoamine oxidase